MDALILAGALNSGPLRHISSAQYEAEIEIAGRPMLDYVVLALESVNAIRRIFVVGSPSMLSKNLHQRVARIIEPGQSMVDSLNNGLNLLGSDEPILVATSDIPLITKEALEDFLKRCEKQSGDLYYSFVPKEVNDQKYPGVQRTYITLREGTFTGGNLVLLSPRVIGKNMELLRKAVTLRKKPIQLVRMLGWRYLWKLAWGGLTIREIEERVSQTLKFNAVGVISPYPEVGIDVDKPSDLRLAQEVLSAR